MESVAGGREGGREREIEVVNSYVCDSSIFVFHPLSLSSIL